MASSSDPVWDIHADSLSGASADPYFSAAYHHLHELCGEGAAIAVAAGDSDTTLLIPGMRVPIPGTGRWDLQSCNGYGGPLTSEDANPAVLARAWREWADWSRSAGGVAAFFRLHPLVDNARWLPPDAVVREDRRTVYVSLRDGPDKAFARATSRHRNMVSRGGRMAPLPEWNGADAWDAFPVMYRTAMDRLRAPSRLQFGSSYFARLRSIPAAQIVSLQDESGIAAAAVFLLGSQWGHYHLSARRADAPNFTGNVLLQAGLERAAALGLQGLHLGGGITPDENDQLLRFKQSLGGEMLHFRTARVIADTAAFESMAARAGSNADGWMLPYRHPSVGVV